MNTRPSEGDFKSSIGLSEQTQIADGGQKEEEKVPWRLGLSCSDTFEKIMKDIEGKVVDRVKKQLLLRRQTVVAIACENEKPQVSKDDAEQLSEVFDLDIEGNSESEEDEEEKSRQHRLKTRAKRGWLLIRRYIREEAMKKKTENKSSMQWSMLKHTMKQMKNMDSARAELYKKYLHPENPRSWTEGMRSIPSDFFSKYGHLTKRSYDPTTNDIEPKKSLRDKGRFSSKSKESFVSKSSEKIVVRSFNKSASAQSRIRSVKNFC